MDPVTTEFDENRYPMKFLCPSCKAKYQIADEKVAGRTLKMKCRQCAEEIVIRGDAAARRSQPALDVGRGSVVGVEARHSGPGRASVIPVSKDEWHIAIDGTPTGPMRREEVARKVAVGAIGPTSLAWREGYADWKPVAEIPELMALCRAAAVGAGMPPPPPPMAPPAVASPPLPEATAPATAPATESSAAAEMADDMPAAEPRVAAMPEPAPAAAASETVTEEAPSGAVSPARSEPEPSAQEAAHAAPPPARESLVEPAGAPLAAASGKSRWGVLFLAISGAALVLVLGMVVGARMFGQTAAAPAATAPEEPAAAPPAVAEEAPAAPTTPPEMDLDSLQGAGEEAAEVVPEEQPEESAEEAKAARPAASSKSKAAADTKESLTDEQRALLERMGGASNSNLSSLQRSSGTTGSAASGGQGLNATQLAAVVNNGKRSLQRCYETALRGSGSLDTVRLDVSITVSPNGNVTDASAEGDSLPGMEKCIKSTVRTWRFPKSDAPTETRFPLLFQPGG